MNNFEKHVHKPINHRVVRNKDDKDYFSTEKIKKREKDRISNSKKYREIQTEYLKTKKKHL